VTRPPPQPPHPGLLRRPIAGFGWLDDRLLHDRWLADLGADPIAVLVLLALAADRYGASFFSRAKMAVALGFDVARVDHALERLRDSQLVAFRPWRPGQRDGVWQILPLPHHASARIGQCISVADILRRLGLAPEGNAAHNQSASS
jgi:hypothetical protein